MNPDFLPIIIGSAAIAIVQMQAPARANIDTVQNIANQVTVQIENSGNPGSGVIIGKNGDTYYVLTARHVLSNKPGEDPYVIKTQQNKKGYKVEVERAIYLPNNIDLGLIEFTSNKNYPVATISEFNYHLYENRDREYSHSGSVESNKQYVFVAGWPIDRAESQQCSKNPPPESCQLPIFNPGFLFDNSASAISNPDVSNSESPGNFGGYELIYTNLTHPGMSGGPILDSQGRLVGIHGRGDGIKLGENNQIIQKYLDEVGSLIKIKIGLSLGIPIQSFLTWASNQTVGNYLTVENSAPSPITQPTIESWQPPLAVEDQSQPFYWLERGNQLWRIGRVAEARGNFNKAIELDSNLYLAWFAKGFASGFDEKYDVALEACDRAIAIYQQVESQPYYEAYRCKAGALQNLGRYQEALDTLNTAIQINGGNPSDFTIQGELKFILRQYEEAQASFSQAIQLRQELNLSPSALLHNNRGLVALVLEQYEPALEDIETALLIDADYAPAWSNKGLCLQRLGRYEESLVAYDKAVEIAPEDYNTWTNRGFTLYKMDRISEAQESFEQALQINPDYQPARDNLELLTE
jgi:tetratricopeptide (TPR) repeat protein/V8-like Glu-specific endopeptidase